VRITRLILQDMRRHGSLDLTLAPGLTVVRGPNEAGKTTIQRAIEIALSRKVTSTQADLDGMRPWQAGPDARPVISLEFVQEDLEATHLGKLEKSFRGARGTVRLEIDNEVITDPAQAEEALAELTGIPTEPFFRSTASVHHHELEELARDEAALRDRLQASISGADRGTSAAKKKLERALRDLQMRGERNPGRLKVAEEAVTRTAASVERGEADLVLLQRDRDGLVVAREHRRAAEAVLAEGRGMLEKARQAERFATDREAAGERFERFRQAVILNEEVEHLQATNPSHHALPVIKQLVERLRSLDRDIAALKASLGDAVEVDFEINVPEPTWGRWALLAMLFSVIAVAITAIGISTASLITPPFIVGVLGSVALGLMLASYAVRKRRAAFDFRRARQLRDDQIARRLRGRSQLESELRDRTDDFAAQLESLQLPDLPAAEDLLARQEAHTQAIERLRARLEGYVGKQPPEVLPQLRDAAALEIEQKTAALEALGPIAREPRARERLESEVRAAEEALEHCRDDEANCRARVEANTVDAEQVAGEAERLVAWREQLAALQRRARVYQETLTAIERAERATMRTATRYLEKKMVADVERITNGRYRRIRVDDRTLDIRVFAPEKADWVVVGQLSQGTVDQIYLAARIGLVRLVTGDRRPPLIFDDPFVTFDDDRAARALELLHDLAADFQVIYLTTSNRYDGVADAVVELPGPTAIDDGTVDDPDAESGSPVMAEASTTHDPDAAAATGGVPVTRATAPEGEPVAGMFDDTILVGAADDSAAVEVAQPLSVADRSQGPAYENAELWPEADAQGGSAGSSLDARGAAPADAAASEAASPNRS
jgi:DNA repair exonuclease SbcCD ATPase subunit